jgi:RHS repeat-associated protein
MCFTAADGQVTGEPPRTSLPTSADGGNLGSGRLDFQPDLFTGRFTYAVPIVVPPGRQNSQPRIALGYNSSYGNGWCGVGWKLELGKIERETRYGVPVSFANGGPSGYDDSKSFHVSMGDMDGHLVQVSPAGQTPVEFRLAVDKSFLKFLYYNQAPNAYWCMVDKSGVQHFFGETSSSCLNNPVFPGRSGSGTFRWALDRVVDPNGNTTSINYVNQGRQLYPKEISYNANGSLPATYTIDFVVAGGRSDQTSSYMSAFRVENDYLLSQIIVRANGQNVRRYALSYTNSPSTLRSLLTSVTEYGSDDASSLPPITFNYQVQQMGFGPLQAWPISSQGETGSDWNSVQAASGDDTYVRLMDIDGDGLPDRIMRKANSPYDSFIVQRNTGTNFEGSYTWGGLSNMFSGYLTEVSSGTTKVDFFDINGDGFPDYVMHGTDANWLVQLNTGRAGSNSFSAATNWGTLAAGFPDPNHESTANSSMWPYTQYDYTETEQMIDMNGDGLPDRLLCTNKTILNYVQYNNGGGFASPYNYNQGGSVEENVNWYEENGNIGVYDYTAAFDRCIDINGDGLPDFLMAWPFFQNEIDVAFNTGMGTDSSGGEFGWPWEPMLGDWGISFVTPQIDLVSTTPFTSDSIHAVQLIDINGDGLPDRVMTKGSSPFTSLEVQLNTGSGFGPLVYWTNVLSEAGTNNQQWDAAGYTSGGEVLTTLIDINGDGLPDRVMRKKSSPYTNLWVQLNQGPFPDLLCKVDNGVGGEVRVTYLPSTQYDNTDRLWTNSPWASGAKSLLPFPIYTVSSITVDDGFGNLSTNTYSYVHGMFDPVWREFRGFNCVTMTDPYGMQTVTYFHQSGGFDDSADGEFQDQGSFSKKGMPYRVETWGSDGQLYRVALNKVIEYTLSTNGWYFPCVGQTIVMDYEGQSSYRATAKQFTYDTNTENLIAEADLGEVANVVVNGQTFTDIGNDSVYSWISYTNIGNILNRPSDARITSDSTGTIRLSESLCGYDGCGNLTNKQAWLDTAGGFITLMSASYDSYGNLHQTTDPVGIQTTFTYDPSYQQYPVSQLTGSFSTQAGYDSRSGQVTTTTDAKGLVSSNSYDVFFRPTASYISTNAYGPPTLWQARTYYTLGGVTNGVSYNCVHRQVNDAVDPANGYETYTYGDGLGRSVQVRAEAETGQFRVADTCYDLRGKPFYQTLPQFAVGAGYGALNGSYLGGWTEYDAIARPSCQTPSVQASFNFAGQLQGLAPTSGDAGSPVGPTTIVYSCTLMHPVYDTCNPWKTLTFDPQGNERDTYADAYGRTIRVVEFTSSNTIHSTNTVNTFYAYDLLGNLTNVTDAAGNVIRMTYDSLGRKISMTDPDMGTWSYAYDNAGRLTAQVDSRTNTIGFFYNDELGRMTSKQIYNAAGSLVGTVSYAYDSSDDPNYTVFKGQLYKVTDLQGYQRSSYDLRGRVLKSARFLNPNAMEYVTQATYDDADRVQQLTYPGNAATLQYSYDTAGHISQVKSLAGTGAQEVFYTPGVFNALEQLTGYTCGNGVSTAYAYYPNSSRLQNVTTGIGGTNIQNLTYTYDTVSDVLSVADGVYTGAASASLNNIVYDHLYRLVSLNSTARGVMTYGYNAIGNILTNQDFGPGQYQYGAQPHAVISANGVSYGYDATGNMTTRGSQTLSYDQQNQLVRVTSTNDSVSFGYDDDGERLWRCGTNGYTIWIGGIYEINNGKVLCHVLAGGQLIATFEPQCTAGMSKVIGAERWYAVSGWLDRALSWPVQKGRGPWTMLAGTWLAILALCLAAGQGASRLRRREARLALCSTSLWRQAVTFVAISAFLVAGVPDAEAATYNPVFYYYHPDRLGSSNVLTDRSGNVVQHYEYAAFGQTTYSGNNSAFPISNRYTGQTADDETGLYYYGGRYYDPQLGRFIQPDPTIPDPTSSQSFNRYSYCGNNPLNAVDPSGFDEAPVDLGDPNDWGPGNPQMSSSSTFIQNGDGTWGASFTFQNAGITQTYSSAGGNGWSSYSASVSWDGGYAAYGQMTATIPGYESDGITVPGMTVTQSSSIFETWAQPVAASAPTAQPAAAPSEGGGGWLAAATNAAGWISMVPGPIGTVAGLVNTAGEAMQGHWGAAAIGLGGALLATVGMGAIAKLGKVAKTAGIVGRGGQFALLDAAKASGEVAHHIPQNAFMRTLGISRAEGPAIGMALEDHALTRTFSGRGASAMKLDVNLCARQRLANDIRDIRTLFGTKYNRGALEAIDYAESLQEFTK